MYLYIAFTLAYKLRASDHAADPREFQQLCVCSFFEISNLDAWELLTVDMAI